MFKDERRLYGCLANVRLLFAQEVHCGQINSVWNILHHCHVVYGVAYREPRPVH
jgi:hypothetical protein